jgi:hypothetical protein
MAAAAISLNELATRSYLIGTGDGTDNEKDKKACENAHDLL